MCSWCWGFKQVWSETLDNLPKSVTVVSLLGGLAPDTSQPMSADMQTMISEIWKTIEKQVPGTHFNHDFWEVCTPRRSTYPACRAVIAARQQQRSLETDMIFAIQKAYYLEARNPSDSSVLLEIADELGLDTDLFAQDLSSKKTQQQLSYEIDYSRFLGANGFPSLILESRGSFKQIQLNYTHASKLLELIRSGL